MTIAVRDLNTLDADTVAQELAEVSARVGEQNPSLDVRRGVVHDVIDYFHALLAAQLRANVDDYLAGRSLIAIEADPTLADPSLVDDVLSNFGLFREAGTRATGEVTVVVSEDVTLTLAVGARFQGGGKTFRTNRVYTAKAESAQINGPGDRLLTRTSDGEWMFTIFVVADEEGAGSKLAKDTLITPLNAPANYVTSYVTNTFFGGKSAETNAELLDRLRQGIACKAPSNRVNMAALLRQIKAFSRVVTSSIIGMGDPEMLRDKHWIFPVGGGGRIDWYVRSEERLTRTTLTKTAVCLSVDVGTNSSLWQLSVGKDDAPGFYELRNVRRPSSTGVVGGFAVEDEVRSLDLSGDGWRPDVVNMVEGDYTRYVTAVIRFRDTAGDQNFTPSQTANYQVEASRVPLIADIQDVLSAPDVRSRPADLLIKAPVPCFVSLAFTIYKSAAQADPNVGDIKNALAAAVNTTPFVGQLYASTLQAVVSDFLPEGQRTGAIDMLGRIRYPGGTTRHLRDDEVLTVPSDAAKLVTARTAQFFLDPSDIGVTIVTAVPINP